MKILELIFHQVTWERFELPKNWEIDLNKDLREFKPRTITVDFTEIF